MTRRIRPDQVKEGMCISGFGGAWFSPPFGRPKFVLTTPGDVMRVRKSGVPYVLIDDKPGVGPHEDPQPTFSAPASHAAARPARTPTGSQPLPDSHDFGESKRNAECKKATALVSRCMNTMRYVFDGVRLGRAVRLSDVIAIVDEIAEFVEQTPRTLLAVIWQENKDEYTYLNSVAGPAHRDFRSASGELSASCGPVFPDDPESQSSPSRPDSGSKFPNAIPLHSVAVCTLMVNVARFMGKGETGIRDFGLAGLLHDIGKMGIPQPVLDKPGELTEAEFKCVRDHPEQGYRLLCKTPNIANLALDVCRHHHERLDGTGYPYGLRGDEISAAVRLGAICDVYDALTSDRIYKQAWSPTKSLASMWGRPWLFDRDLLLTFMRSIGVFPAGMLERMIGGRTLAATA